MTGPEARRHLARMARREFGDRWVPAIDAFWGAWRCLGLPELDEADGAQVLSAMAIVLSALKAAELHVDGDAPALRAARAALGLPLDAKAVD